MIRSKGFCAAGGIILLSACVSHEYGLINAADNRPFGYNERVVGENQVIVQAVGPNSALARSYFDLRVSELCPFGDANTNIYRANFAAAPNMFGPIEMGAVMEGTVTCDGLLTRTALETLSEATESSNEIEGTIEP